MTPVDTCSSEARRRDLRAKSDLWPVAVLNAHLAARFVHVIAFAVREQLTIFHFDVTSMRFKRQERSRSRRVARGAAVNFFDLQSDCEILDARIQQ